MKARLSAVSIYFILPPSSSPLLLATPVGQHALDALLVGLCNHHVDVEDALALGRLLRQDVARVRVAALGLARRGLAETLRRALVCLQFRHDNSPKSCQRSAISFQLLHSTIQAGTIFNLAPPKREESRSAVCFVLTAPKIEPFRPCWEEPAGLA